MSTAKLQRGERFRYVLACNGKSNSTVVSKAVFSTLNVNYASKPNPFHFRNVCTWDLGGEQCQNNNLDIPTNNNQPRRQQQ